jgi:hypothetical protein
MELQNLWNELSSQIDNSNNSYVENTYLKNTQISKLKNGKIIQGRFIDEHNNYLFLLENNNNYIILKMNISSKYPIEKSRIDKYEELCLNLELYILNHRLEVLLDKFIQKLNENIQKLNIFTSKPYNYKLKNLPRVTFYLYPTNIY